MPANFDSAFDIILNEAPKDFDIIFLNGTVGKFQKPLKYSEHFYRVFEMYGAFGYLVSSKAYDEIIKAFEVYQGILGTDYIYSFLMKRLSIYKCAKPIVFHKAGWSDRAESIPNGYKHLEFR